VKVHRLSQIDVDKKRARCLLCGVVEIWLQVKGGGRKQWRCMEWRKQYARKRYKTEAYQRYHREYRLKWDAANRHKISGYNRRALLKTHGLTEADFSAMVEERKGTCDLCGKKPRRLCLDHDHHTLQIRGLLCDGCNLALGHFKDKPEVAARVSAYLGGNLR
jgi:hypothetical protein